MFSRPFLPEIFSGKCLLYKLTATYPFLKKEKEEKKKNDELHKTRGSRHLKLSFPSHSNSFSQASIYSNLIKEKDREVFMDSS